MKEHYIEISKSKNRCSEKCCPQSSRKVVPLIIRYCVYCVCSLACAVVDSFHLNFICDKKT